MKGFGLLSLTLLAVPASAHAAGKLVPFVLSTENTDQYRFSGMNALGLVVGCHEDQHVAVVCYPFTTVHHTGGRSHRLER